MNEITHRKIIIEFDVWAPFRVDAERDIDELLALKKEHRILAHCGNVHMIIEGETRATGQK